LILLVAFGKRGYGLMAHNLAFSIRHNSPKVKIGLWIDAELYKTLPDKSLFDDIRILEESQYRDSKGNVDPAIAKAQIYRLGCQMSDRFLFLDVDGLCINDLEPFLKRLEGLTIATEVLGQGSKDDTINYSVWASNETIWEHFGLNEDATLCGIQSSWAYFEKSDIGDLMQEWLDYFMAVGVPYYKLLMQWGGTIPDELLYQAVYAKLGIIPRLPNEAMKPIFFGHGKAKQTEEEVLSDYYILSIYGNGSGRTLVKPKFIKLYDKQLKAMGNTYGFNAKSVMVDKHVNRK